MTDETEDQRWERLSKDRVDRPLPKRFYKTVSVGDDLAILLDGRAVKTPMKQKLILPTRKLADAVAAEWQAVDKLINPANMSLTKLANTAIDTVTASRKHVADEVIAYAGNDLVCYRAEKPADLVALQAKAWDPILTWANVKFGVKFVKAKGVIHESQPPAALHAVEVDISRIDNFALTAVHNVMTLTGSALMALMLHDRAITADAAWDAAHIDEDFQIEQWGADNEATKRRAWRKADFMASSQFMNLLQNA